MSRHFNLLSSYALLGWLLFITIPVQGLELGDPPSLSDKYFELPYTLRATTSGFIINSQQREEVRNFFNTVYQASEDIPIEWTGNINQCEPGTTSLAYQEAIVLRVNFFRALAGLPAGITLNNEWNRKAQQAALMMSANSNLSHNPPTSWTCYTIEGADAAGNSNLSWGQAGAKAINGQMEDSGDGNAVVGHRRWILYPQTQVMGTGSVGVSGSFQAASALWVFDSNALATRPTVRDDFVSWPSPGFVPYTLVFPRWSLSYPKADFSQANVTMQQSDRAISVNLEPISNGFGENTLVWVPNLQLPSPFTNDVTYSVKVSNVLINGTPRTFDYTVTAFNPSVLGKDSVFPTISGNTQVAVNTDTTYTFNSVPGATSYQWMQARRQAFTQIEGAESGLDNFTVTTTSGYNVISNDSKASGTSAFHLAHPQPTSQILTLNRSLLVGSAAQLVFASRLGVASPQQVAKVQVSVDDGKTWQEVFSQAGVTTNGSSSSSESNFSTKTIALNQFAGKTIHVRFAYVFTGGNYYPQTSTAAGWYIDDIRFTGVEELINPTINNIVQGTGFTFNPTQTGDYALQVRAVVYGKYPLEWGNAQLVTTDGNIPIVPPTSTSTGVSLGKGQSTDNTGNIINTASSFNGGIKVNNGDFKARVEQQLSDTVEVVGGIKVDPADVGQVVNIVIFAGYKPSVNTPDTEVLWFMLDRTGGILAWDLQLDKLVGFKEKVTLTADVSIPMYKGKFLAPGLLNVFFGYQKADGSLINNFVPIFIAINP